MSRRFFEGAKHAMIYAAARPRYSDKVFDHIFKYCQTRGGKFKLAVDVACGTGHQSTLPLVGRFEKVIGVDVSEEQLKQAPKNVANLEFRQSTAEHLSFLDPNSVDLVTAACGLHWFNIPEFFSEIERVLSPGGCLAVYCYGWVSLQQSAAQDILRRFIRSKLCDFHNDGTRMCTDGYKDVELPFQDTQKHSVDLKMDWTVDQLCDFIQSTALWQNRLKKIPNCDSLNVLAKE
ncbi:putative methyltransferase DDB_G0268948 [Haliotis rubra]|uniref:putative methyltransferase DDB_G0268948 n=1 Tax=Haliotis rubra TaxID=36100 RepID=UPI001EE5660F|nr:putative methyltransferase DDB_G0268948 [Haliotis rubra]